jgi:hypothetical protein
MTSLADLRTTHRQRKTCPRCGGPTLDAVIAISLREKDGMKQITGRSRTLCESCAVATWQAVEGTLRSEVPGA